MKFLKMINIILIVFPFAYIMYHAERIRETIHYKWSVLTPYELEGTISYLCYFITTMILVVAILARYTKEKNKKEEDEQKKKKRKWRQHILTFEILLMTSLYTYKIVGDNVNSYDARVEYTLLITMGIIFLTVIYDVKKEGVESAKKRLLL